MKRISVVIGTRPEAIKMAPIILALKREDVELSICKTGQHTDMVDLVFDVFNIKAGIDFSIMDKTNNLNDMVALLINKFQSYFLDFKPDLVLFQGDTASVFASALAAFNLQIDTAHVEAGLRTGNLSSPWPEEGFRSMISPITKYHFAPTKTSLLNLIKAGIPEKDIFVTGNTVIDALYEAEEMIESGMCQLNLPEIVINSKNLKRILITGHRRENFGSGLDNLCRAIANLAERYSNIDFIFPVHLNPVVQKQINTFFEDKKLYNILLIEPQPYLEFVWLMKNSLLIITDSGGIQEEAPSLGKPVLVTRDTTERPEGVESGTVKLVGKGESSLFDSVCSLIDNENNYLNMSTANNPYGDGMAAKRIVDIILER